MSGSRCILALGILLIACAPRSLADDLPADAVEGVPPFHRTYIPADEIGKRNWPAGYLPIDAKEFEQLVETIRAGARGAPGAAAAVVESAHFEAQLQGDDLLVGAFQLHLHRRAQSPASLILDPCNVSISKATWSDEQDQPAQLAAGADGRLRVVVAGERLGGSWSMRGERTATGAFGFRLQLPRCPMIRLSLALPKGLELLADQGIVSKVASADESLTRWTVELGGHHQVLLRLAPEEAARERRPLTLLRQSTAYEFTPRGVNVVVQLKLDVHGEPLQRIAVDLDPGLRLVAARFGELEIPWSITPETLSGGSQATLELPEPIVGSGRVVQLSAIAPLETGVRWRMPNMRPQGLSWQEGTAQILVPSLFLLEQLDADGCRQSRLTALPAPLSGESIEVQYFRPNATLDVVISQTRELPAVDTGTLVEVGAGEITSRCAIELSLVRGQRRAIKLSVQPAWVIDAVENPDSSGNPVWEVDESVLQQPILKISLPAALTADKPARLLVRGHRAVPAQPTFPAQALQMLSVEAMRPVKRLVAVRAIEGAEVRWAGPEELHRLDVEQLTPKDVKLFPQPLSWQLFVEDDAFSEARLNLERRRPAYNTEIRVDAVVQKKLLTETYTIQCTPDSARVERLLIHLSQARTAPLEWNLAGGNTGEFSARRMSAAEQMQTGLPLGGEVWELNLQLARPGAFELRGVRSVEFTGEIPLALASVSDAASQRGTVAIRALGDTGLTIRNRRLAPVPAELLDADRYQTARATYHYQPGRDDLDGQPAVSVAPGEALQCESGAWAWNLRLESRYGQQGPALHSSTFYVQTAGRSQVRVWLPDAAELLAVWVDDRRLPAVSLAADHGLNVELPAGRGFVTITLSFSTNDSLPSLVGSFLAPFPRLDCPVMAQQWTLWTPDGYALFDPSRRVDGDESSMLSWSQRLFGALGRSGSQKVFNPLNPDDWSAGAAEAEAGRQAASHLGETLSGVLQRYANDEALTWGQLLGLCAEGEAAFQRTLLIDADELESIGLTPQTRVRITPGDGSSARGLAALKHARLCLVVSGSNLLITTLVAAESFGDEASRSGDVVVASARNSYGEDLRQAARLGSTGRFQGVATWLAAPLRAAAPWLPTAGLAGSQPEGPQWQAHRLRFASTQSTTVRVSNLAAMSSLAWASFLAVLAGGLWIKRWKHSVLLALAAVFGFAALVLPAAYVPPFSAALLACLAALTLAFINPESRASAAPDASRSQRKPRTSIIQQLSRLPSILTVLLFTWAASAAQPPSASTPASDPPAKTEAATAKTAPSEKPQPNESAPSKQPIPKSATEPHAVYRVFVPINEQQQPAGEKIYLSQELYSQLSRRAATLSDQQNPWLLFQASYQGSLARDPASRRLSLAKLVGRLEFQVLRSGAQIRLPLPRGNRTGVTALRLEGRSVPLVWNETGTELIVGPLAAERFRLEIDFQPTVDADSTTAGFDVPIVALPQATLELKFPPDAPAIELPTVRGAIRVAKQRGEITADLGNADHLAVRWPVSAGMETPAPNLEVDELLWVKVRPGTTLIDARFKYRVLTGSVRHIRLLTDPRLRMLPPASAQSLIAGVQTVPGEPQKVDLELRRPVTDEVVIDLSFLVTSASGVGNLRLPRLESSGARAAKRYLGVSVDAALQPRIQAGEDSKTLEIADFASAWGASDTRPQAAYSVPRGEPVWVLATQPNEPRLASEQTLSLSLGRSQALVQLESQLSISGGHLLRLTLQGPPGILVDEVSVVEDELQRVSRWSVSPDGRITVFLNAPVDGKQKLTLRGRWNFGTAAALAKPYFEILGAEVKKRQLHIYRQPAVLVQVALGPGVSPAEGEAGESPELFGANVGRFNVDSPPAPLSLTISPNAARSRAVGAIFIERDADDWTAELNYHVQVQEGLIDTLQFEIPPQWSEPFRVDAPFKVVPVPGELRRQLIVYPPKPVSDKYELRIRGRVAPSAGDRLRVPDIRSPGMEQVERYVVLPQQRDLQQITWETLGLTPAKLPPEFAARRVGQSYTIYQVAGESFQASLRAFERATATARVALADMHLAWQLDGHFEALAAFEVEPGGAANCTLELPDDCRLVHASIEGLPAQATELAPQRWRIAFQSQQLPQHIEITYTGMVEGSHSERRFVAPRLAGLDVANTLWTVYGPRSFGTAATAGTAEPSNAVRHELARMAAVNGLARLPAEVIGEHLPEEIARWYRPWKARSAKSRGSLRWNLSPNGQTNAVSADAMEAGRLESQLEAIDRRLQGAGGRGFSISLAPGGAEMLTLFRTGSAPTYVHSPGAAAELALNYPRRAEDSLWLRWLAGLALLVVFGAGAFFLLDRRLPTFAPWLVVGVVGLAWWLLLAPSALGLLALAVACVFAARSRWQTDIRMPSAA